MLQTFYIENDEEIISVIGRLRKSSAQENYFVFPKRALVLQSIVNLRLFQREAEKLGKKIIIVTQDEEGKKMAEKAGLETENYSDDFSQRSAHLELAAEQKSPKPEKAIAPPNNKSVPRSQDIGSMDFYATPVSSIPKAEPVGAPSKAPATSDGMNLRIRNASPVKQTSLNSMRSEVGGEQKKPASSTMMFNPSIALDAPSLNGRAPQVNPTFNKPVERTSSAPVPQAPLPTERQSIQASREERLKNFFGPGAPASGGGSGSRPPVHTFPPKAPTPNNVPSASQGNQPVVSKKARHIFLILGTVSLLSILGVLLFVFLPKAEVKVVPHKTTRTIDQQFDGRSTGDMSDGSVVPVRVAEKDQVVNLAVAATGTAPGSAQKARGTVTIMNEFSADPQSLVATTRFESPDGKVFRLIEGVTIPGMKDGKAGVIDAPVIADQTGSEYNIAPTTFKIPGFKGSAKYDKFSAKSSKAMMGGGNATGSEISVISKQDIEKAEREAKEKAKEAYLEAVKADLMPEEKVLEEGMEITALNGSALPVVGTAAASFDYQNTYKVRAFIFSEKLIKEKIEVLMTEDIGGVPFKPVSIALTFGESLPNYAEGTVRLKTHASVVSESVIDREELATELLGKDEDGINAVLATSPEIKKVQVNFKPQWFASTIPNSKDRVIILVEPGEE